MGEFARGPQVNWACNEGKSKKNISDHGNGNGFDLLADWRVYIWRVSTLGS